MKLKYFRSWKTKKITSSKQTDEVKDSKSKLCKNRNLPASNKRLILGSRSQTNRTQEHDVQEDAREEQHLDTRSIVGAISFDRAEISSNSRHREIVEFNEMYSDAGLGRELNKDGLEFSLNASRGIRSFGSKLEYSKKSHTRENGTKKINENKSKIDLKPLPLRKCWSEPTEDKGGFDLYSQRDPITQRRKIVSRKTKQEREQIAFTQAHELCVLYELNTEGLELNLQGIQLPNSSVDKNKSEHKHGIHRGFIKSKIFGKRNKLFSNPSPVC